MDLELNEEQAMLVESIENIGERYREMPSDHRRDYHYYAHDLGAVLEQSGFLDVARTDGLGGLEAALVVERVARLPVVVEIGASALVAPQLSSEPIPGPIAIIWHDLDMPHRFLPVAKSALVVDGDKVVVIEVDPANVQTCDTILAYPYGKFLTRPNLSKGRVLEGVTPAAFRSWARISIAAECAGAMRAALDFTVDYVKQRRLFGRALGSFQAVQHRLAQCHQIAQGAALVSYRAGQGGDALSASLAASYAQMHIGKFVFDVHQFNGAMGMTNEHKLHFWTYRLRALQAEFGGAHEAALDAADLMWSDAA